MFFQKMETTTMFDLHVLHMPWSFQNKYTITSLTAWNISIYVTYKSWLKHKRSFCKFCTWSSFWKL